MAFHMIHTIFGAVPGFADAGEGWRVSSYETDNIEPITEELFQQVLPLYKQLHAYVRRKLINFYSSQHLDSKGTIPAHILGKWQWNYMYYMLCYNWQCWYWIMLTGDFWPE